MTRQTALAFSLIYDYTLGFALSDRASDPPPTSTPSSAASNQRGAATLGNPGDDQDQAAGRRSRDSAPGAGFTRL